MSQRTRRWWRNLAERPDVEIVLRGERISTVARVVDGDEAREAIATSLLLDRGTGELLRRDAW